MSGYVKNTWVNQDVERPKTYEVTTNADGSITLTDSFGLVTELGTPVNADNMNHIEDGLTKVAITEYDNTFTYAQDDWVTGTINGEKQICKSLQNNNTGKALTNSDYWEVLNLGGSGTGYQMFDICMKDHVLSFDETKGFAPLGTYVYKEAIAGTRYGYPDFYAKCVEEYTDSDTTTQYISLRSDITEVGTVANNNGIVSGFSSSNYYYTEYVPSFTNSIKIIIPFSLQSLPTANSALLGNHTANAKCSQILVSTSSLYANTSDGSGWISGNQISIENVSWETNVNYVAEYSITGKRNIALKLYKNGVLLGSDSKTVSADAGWTTGFEIGNDMGNSFTSGSIDLNGFSIDCDGVRTWIGTHNYKEAANKHRFYDICNKAYYDNFFGITGEAWYYGVDTTNERIFLPRSTRFKNGTSVDVGQYQEAGLPNITGGLVASDDNNNYATGAFQVIRNEGTEGTAGTDSKLLSFDASRSNSIYGNSTTVEYSSTKLIPYMVVGNQSDWAGMTDVVNQGMTILSQVNAGLATKLDLDLTNITNATKRTIAGYAMPDYNAGISVTSPYTAIYDCIFIPLLAGNPLAMDIYVDGIIIGREGVNGSNPIDQGHQYLIPKGSTLTFSTTGSSSTYTVYPLKGEINNA